MTQTVTRPERLDRLQFGGKHRRLLVGSGIGWALDAMDVGLIAFILAALIKQWDLDSTQSSVVAATGSLGMAVGASVGGLLADRIGRRTVFAATLVVYGLATGLSAFAPAPGATVTVWTAVLVLSGLRFIVGLGLGAELPVASTLMSEFAPSSIRARVVVILEGFWALGWIAAAVIANLVVSKSDSGWRIAFALGAIPAIYAIVIRAKLPESVRFLEGKGRSEEAERIVREFESDQHVRPTQSPDAPAVPAAPLSALFDSDLRRRTLGLWTTWFGINFGYYGAAIWTPSLLAREGYSIATSFQLVLIMTIAQLPGYAAAAYLIERWGRRPTLATFLVGSAVSAIAFSLSGSELMIVISGCLLSFFNLGAWGALYAATPEIYPTTVRATGSGSAAAFGRIASIIAPLAVPFLSDSGGLALVFGTFSVAFVVAAAGALLMPEWRGRDLQER